MDPRLVRIVSVYFQVWHHTLYKATTLGCIFMVLSLFCVIFLCVLVHATFFVVSDLVLFQYHAKRSLVKNSSVMNCYLSNGA